MFQEQIYQPDRGVAMGSPISGTMAKIFIHQSQCNTIIRQHNTQLTTQPNPIKCRADQLSRPNNHKENQLSRNEHLSQTHNY